MSHDESKLPKWAQQELNHLRYQVKRFEEQAANQNVTSWAVTDWLTGRPRFIDDHDRVRFWPNIDQRDFTFNTVADHIDVSLTHDSNRQPAGALTIRGLGGPSAGQLLVLPEAANTIVVRLAGERHGHS